MPSDSWRSTEIRFALSMMTYKVYINFLQLVQNDRQISFGRESPTVTFFRLLVTF